MPAKGKHNYLHHHLQAQYIVSITKKKFSLVAAFRGPMVFCNVNCQKIFHECHIFWFITICYGICAVMPNWWPSVPNGLPQVEDKFIWFNCLHQTLTYTLNSSNINVCQQEKVEVLEKGGYRLRNIQRANRKKKKNWLLLLAFFFNFPKS